MPAHRYLRSICIRTPRWRCSPEVNAGFHAGVSLACGWIPLTRVGVFLFLSRERRLAANRISSIHVHRKQYSVLPCTEYRSYLSWTVEKETCGSAVAEEAGFRTCEECTYRQNRRIWVSFYFGISLSTHVLIRCIQSPLSVHVAHTQSIMFCCIDRLHWPVTWPPIISRSRYNILRNCMLYPSWTCRIERQSPSPVAPLVYNQFAITLIR